MKVYEVISKFFDNGKVMVVIETHEMKCVPENTSERTLRCDIYHDYYTSKDEAVQAYKDAKSA